MVHFFCIANYRAIELLCFNTQHCDNIAIIANFVDIASVVNISKIENFASMVNIANITNIANIADLRWPRRRANIADRRWLRVCVRAIFLLFGEGGVLESKGSSCTGSRS